MTFSKPLTALLLPLALLAGCANLPSYVVPPSPCARSEASMECQVQRYHDVAAD